MDVNLTSKPWSSVPINYHLYIIEGALMFISNLWIMAAIVRYPTLRNKKTYLIMAGLAFADALAGLAYLTAGMYRSYMVVSGESEMVVTSWECMQKLHVVLFVFGAPLAAVMLICVSLDRLLAVIVPLKYFKLGASYAYKLVGVFYLYGILSGFVLTFVSSLQENIAKYAKTCSTWNAIGNEYGNRYYFLVRVVGGLVSVILYIFIPLLYRKSVKSAKKANQTAELQKIRRQKRLLITCGLSASCTFLFFVLPNVLRTYLTDSEKNGVFDTAFQYVSVIQNVNPIMNFVFYMSRHADIRNALLNFLTCKPQPVASIATVKDSTQAMRKKSSIGLNNVALQTQSRNNSIRPESGRKSIARTAVN